MCGIADCSILSLAPQLDFLPLKLALFGFVLALIGFVLALNWVCIGFELGLFWLCFSQLTKCPIGHNPLLILYLRST